MKIIKVMRELCTHRYELKIEILQCPFRTRQACSLPVLAVREADPRGGKLLAGGEWIGVEGFGETGSTAGVGDMGEAGSATLAGRPLLGNGWRSASSSSGRV